MAALRGVDEAHEVNILFKFMVKYFVVGHSYLLRAFQLLEYQI